MCAPPSIFLFNARSVLPKLDDLCVSISAFKPDIVFVTETWLTDDIDDVVLAIPRFGLLRSDRLNRRGGGVCAWFHESLKPSILSTSRLCPSSIESLFLQLRSGSFRYFLFLLYIPPGLPKQEHDDIVLFMTHSLDDAMNIDPDARILVCGDFNDFPQLFLSEQFGLLKKVHSPTRGSAILDQILVDCDLCDAYESSASIGPPIKNSDHCTIFLRPLVGKKHDFNQTFVYVWDF